METQGHHTLTFWKNCTIIKEMWLFGTVQADRERRRRRQYVAWKCFSESGTVETGYQ